MGELKEAYVSNWCIATKRDYGIGRLITESRLHRVSRLPTNQLLLLNGVSNSHFDVSILSKIIRPLNELSADCRALAFQ